TDPRGRVHQRRRDQGRRRRWRAGVPNGGVSGTRGGGNTPPARGPVGAASAAIVESAKPPVVQSRLKPLLQAQLSCRSDVSRDRPTTRPHAQVATYVAPTSAAA